MKYKSALAALLAAILLIGGPVSAEIFAPAGPVVFFEPETFARTYNRIANDLGLGALAIYVYQTDEEEYYTFISDCGFDLLYGGLSDGDPSISLQMLVKSNADFDYWTKATSMFAQACTSLGFPTDGFGEFARDARDGDQFSCDFFTAVCTRRHFENDKISGEDYDLYLKLR